MPTSSCTSVAANAAEQAGQLIDNLSQPERDLLMKVSVLPEITPEIVRALGDANVGQNVLDALHRRQLLVTRGKHAVFHLHDLLRDSA